MKSWLFLIIALISASAVAAPPIVEPVQVEVINSPEVNVTNTPDVNVTNTPDVNIANTPNVNVGNTPDVNVANTPNVNVVSMPDGNSVQPYSARYQTTASVADGVTECFFDVPSGKILHVEKVSGFTRKGNVLYLHVLFDNSSEIFLVPRQNPDISNSSVIYDGEQAGYAADTDAWEDPDGNLRDISVNVVTDNSINPTGNARCLLSGRLFDAPAP